ncbi:hypothetical protein Zm00014a_021342 [Zea mays]|uniref:Uncharacterized protein n=1 Tax=Zea mays TaxID=4577 RepID=A0A3L6G8D2_MAIZE|nr:hypothetical protein Zm00014a_021342 [Zea mays]
MVFSSPRLHSTLSQTL